MKTDLDRLVDEAVSLNQRLQAAYDTRLSERIRIERVWWKSNYRLERRLIKFHA